MVNFKEEVNNWEYKNIQNSSGKSLQLDHIYSQITIHPQTLKKSRISQVWNQILY